MFMCRKRNIDGGDLPADTLVELERRGPVIVREQMAKAPGFGSGALFPMHAGLQQDPVRQQVERWLAEHAKADEDLATCRHRQVLFWAIAATTAGLIAIGVSVGQWISS